MNLPLWGWIALGVIVLLVLVIWSIRRHRNPILQVRTEAGIAGLVPSLAGLTLGSPVPGNAVVLHENGAYFDVLLQRIAAARHSVHFEMYLWKDGELGRRVAAALAERAAGFDVGAVTANGGISVTNTACDLTTSAPISCHTVGACRNAAPPTTTRVVVPESLRIPSISRRTAGRLNSIVAEMATQSGRRSRMASMIAACGSGLRPTSIRARVRRAS